MTFRAMALYIVGMTTAYDDINPTGSINDQLAQMRAVLNVEILSMATDRQLDEVEAGIARAQQALDQLCAIHESSTRYLDLTVQRLASRLAAAEGPYRAADMASPEGKGRAMTTTETTTTEATQ